VYLVTMGPGGEVYERFGHTSIVIRDEATGAGEAFGYGVFSFQQEHFILRFIEGRMLYEIAEQDPDQMIEAYRQADRSIWIAELNMTSAQKVALLDFLEWNARPENRSYLYDYYTDNCSTRVRDALNGVLRDQIRRQLEPTPAGTTYRWQTLRVAQYNPAICTALDFVLGHFVDRPLSAWQECFLPTLLQQRLRQVKVVDEQGQLVPLVKWEKQIYVSRQWHEPTAPPKWLLWYLLAGIAIGAMLGLLGHWANRVRACRIALAVFSPIWMFVLGGAGTFLAGAWIFTSHVAVYDNENLFHFSPLALAMVLLMPALVLGRKWAGRPAWWIAWMMAISAIAGLLVKLLPMFYQVNWEMIALTLPGQFGLIWAVYKLAGGAKTRETAAEGVTPPHQPPGDGVTRRNET